VKLAVISIVVVVAVFTWKWLVYTFEGIVGTGATFSRTDPNAVIAELTRERNALPQGRISVHAATTMHVGHPYRISVLAATNERVMLRDEKSDLPTVPLNDGNDISMGPFMRAILEGGQFFNVAALQPDEPFAFDPNNAMRWQWDVTPIVDGEHVLNLTILAVVPPDHRFRKVKSISIKVVATLPDRLSSFVMLNWQWVWTTIAAPVGISAWLIWKKRKKRSSPDLLIP